MPTRRPLFTVHLWNDNFAKKVFRRKIIQCVNSLIICSGIVIIRCFVRLTSNAHSAAPPHTLRFRWHYCNFTVERVSVEMRCHMIYVLVAMQRKYDVTRYQINGADFWTETVSFVRLFLGPALLAKIVSNNLNISSTHGSSFARWSGGSVREFMGNSIVDIKEFDHDTGHHRNSSTSSLNMKRIFTVKMVPPGPSLTFHRPDTRPTNASTPHIFLCTLFSIFK